MAAPKTIKIGWAGDLSAQLVKPSLGIYYGAQLAVNERNQAGGIKGAKVEIVQLDDQCDPKKAVEVANTFVANPDIVAILGHVCSGATIAAEDIYNKAKMVMVSASSTAFGVTARGLDNVNRVVFTDDTQAKALALYMYRELGIRKLALFDDGQSYGSGLAVSIERYFKPLGGQIVNTTSINKDSRDYTEQLERLVDVSPDGLFFGGYQGPAALLAQQMRSVGLTNVKFIGADGIYTSDFLTRGGADTENAFASTVVQQVDKARLDKFKDDLHKTFNIDYDEYQPYQPNGYDAASILMNAMESVAYRSSDGTVSISKTALIAAVRQTTGYKGMTGVLTCDTKGDCGAGDVSINTVKNGKWAQLKIYTLKDLN